MKKLLIAFLFIVSCTRQSGINSYADKNNAETKKVVFLIYGYPACGKLTIAKELAKKYNLNLMDNHFFNNIIFPYVELNTPNVIAIDPEINKIRKIWIDNVVKYGKKDKGFVFTNVLITSKSAENDVANIRDFASSLGFQFVPVKLVCDYADIEKRINTVERKKRHKLVDFDSWKKYVENTEFLDVKDSLIINNKDINSTLKTIDLMIDGNNDKKMQVKS